MRFSSIGKYVDQPLILNKFEKNMPAVLIGAGSLYGIFDTYNSSRKKNNNNKKKTAIKNAIIITSTITASLAGAKGVKTNAIKFNIFNKTINLPSMQIIPQLLPSHPLNKILQKQNLAVDEFLNAQKPKNKNILRILNKARNSPLKPLEIEYLTDNLNVSDAKKKLFNVILPEPENLNSKAIFSEIGRLSLLGAIPVAGGVLGGIFSDMVTATMSKKATSNKIKEGFYQYFANIFLCNVGASAALFIAEALQKAGKIKPLSPAKKMLVILTGITATGIIGGSYIANKMSQKIIDPLFNKAEKNKKHKSVYEERKPELVDIALHADDIATAGVLSGFKWIEPALPLMYFVSGYRAGTGYRN